MSWFRQRHFLQKLFIIIGLVTFFFGIWQIDLTVGALLRNDAAFTFGEFLGHKFTTSVWGAYDLCQALMVLGLVIVFFSLWLWND